MIFLVQRSSDTIKNLNEIKENMLALQEILKVFFKKLSLSSVLIFFSVFGVVFAPRLAPIRPKFSLVA